MLPRIGKTRYTCGEIRKVICLRDAREGSNWETGLKGINEGKAAEVRLLFYERQINREVQRNFGII